MRQKEIRTVVKLIKPIYKDIGVFLNKVKGGSLQCGTNPPQNSSAEFPRLYETENIPLKDKLIHLHFFIGGCDWFIAEYDGEDLFWGYAILNNDHEMAEWGYISFEELKKLRIPPGIEIDCEIFNTPRKAAQIDRITHK